MSDLSLAFLRAIASVSAAGTPAGTPGPLLYGLVRQMQPDTVVEVGAWKGHSTLWLAQGCRDNGRGRVYAIDDWSLFGGERRVLEENVIAAGLEAQVVLVSGDSLSVAWPPAVDLAFIDGCHDLAHPRAELERAMAAGARTVVLHDTTSWWGPRRLVELLRRDERVRLWDILDLPGRGDEDGVAILQRREAAPGPAFTEQAYPTGAI